MRKTVLLGLVVMTTSAFLGCAKNFDKQVQNSTLSIAESDTINHKEKQKMLDEIYAKPIRGGERISINDVILRFIPIGTNMAEATRILQNQGIYKITESNGLIDAENDKKENGSFPALKYTEIRLIFNADKRLIDTQSFVFLDSL